MSHPSIESPVLEISLLGGFGLRVGGREIAVSRKARALLAYLASNPGQPATREAVSDLLWTRSGAEQARHSLRQTLVEMRRVFTAEGIEPLAADIGTLRLAADRVTVDITAFRAAAASTAEADWAEADRLYSGPFLDRFPAVSPGFDDWLTQERTTWTERALETMARLADAKLEAGDARAAVTLCERMLRLDPLREDNHRRLMTAYLTAGRRADAVRQYHACVTLLRQDLDVGPSAETEALFQRLRTGNDKLADKPRGFAEERERGPEPRAIGIRSLLAAAGVPVVAILPFRSPVGEVIPEWFGEGIAEDIVGVLAGLREPVVISSNSSRRFRDTDFGLAHIGDALGADYVASGSVRVDGRSARIAVELAEARSGMVVWWQAYDVSLTGIFDVQAAISARIANALVPRLNEAELFASRRKGPEDLGAYHLVLQARDRMFHFTPDTLDEAGLLLESAATRDPYYAPIYAAMIEWRCYRIFQGWSTDREADIRGLEAAASAVLRLDPNHARALALYGHNRTIIGHDYQESLDLLDRAVDAGPNDAEALIWSSPTLAFVGRTDEAIARASRAIELSPQDPMLFRYEHFLGIGHYLAGDLDKAAEVGLRSVARHPNFTSNLRYTVAALAGLGRKAEAAPLVERLMALQPTLRVAASLPRYPFTDQSKREQHARYLRLAGVPG